MVLDVVLFGSNSEFWVLRLLAGYFAFGAAQVVSTR